MGTTSLQLTVRRLDPEDASSVSALRRRAVLDAPLAFGASVDDDPGQNIPAVQQLLTHVDSYAIVGAFTEELIGMVGLQRGRGIKRRHGIEVWGLFVRAEMRGKGIARSLMDEAISIVREWPHATTMKLSVHEHAEPARALYEKLGFIHWGTEPQALNFEGKSYAEHHLALDLIQKSAFVGRNA